MRNALMIAILVGSLGGCTLVPGASPIPPQSAEPSPVASPSGAATTLSPVPSATPSLLQLGEAFLVVASKYEHAIDLIEDRHLHKTVKDYNAYCRETSAATAEYVVGLRAITFGPDQQPAVDTLIDDLKAYDTLLGPCMRGRSLPTIRKSERSRQDARAMAEDAAVEVRQVLNLPIPGG